MTSLAISARQRWVRPSICALALFVTSGAARAEEPTLSEVKYHPSESPPSGTGTRIVLTGLGISVLWYGAAVGTSYAWPHAPNTRDLRLPVVGPWMALGDVGCGSAEPHCTTGIVVLRTVFAVLSGVGQIGGLAMATEGLFVGSGGSSSGTSESVPSGDGTEPAPSSIGPRRERSWAAVPVPLPDGAALAFIGRF